MTNLIDFYFEYGEGLATAIPAIGHTPDHSRFVKITEVGEPAEFVQAATNRLQFDDTVLVWEMFTDSPQSASGRSYTSLIEGTFAVMRKGASVTDRLRMFNETRPIALEVLKKMVEDGAVGPLQENRLVLQIDGSGEGIGPLASTWFGWAFSFRLRVPLF